MSDIDTSIINKALHMRGLRLKYVPADDESVDPEARLVRVLDDTDTGYAIQFAGCKFVAYTQVNDTEFRFGVERSELRAALLDCLTWLDNGEPS